MSPASDDDIRGLRRFHKVTIGAGVVFCGLVAIRFSRTYGATGRSVYVLYGVLAGVAGVLLLIYWIRFWRRGVDG